MQSKKLYAWETGPVDDRALALFCGDNPDFKVGLARHRCQRVICIDEQISATALHLDRNVKYHVHPRTAIALKALRQRMTGIMNATMRGKALDEDSAKWFNLAIKCLGSLSEEVATPIGLLS
jgi:ATP-dependent RNA helicase DHX29